MKYMMLFWVDESAETTADEDAAIMVAVKSWVDQMTERGIMVHGGALRSAGEAPTWMRPSGSRPDIRWRGPPRSRAEYKRGKVRFAGHAER